MDPWPDVVSTCKVRVPEPRSKTNLYLINHLLGLHSTVTLLAIPSYMNFKYIQAFQRGAA